MFFFCSCLRSTGPSPLGLSQRLALIIDGVCRVVAARGGRDRALTPMMNLLWARLRRMAARFECLAAQVRAASFPAAPAATLRPTARAQRPPPARRLPRGFAWLIRLAPEAACYGGQLQHMLADQEMAALLRAEPKLRRLLRPLCNMLAIHPGPELLAPLRRVDPACGSPASGTPEPVPPASAEPPPDGPRCPRYATDVRAAALVVVSDRRARLRRALRAPA